MGLRAECKEITSVLSCTLVEVLQPYRFTSGRHPHVNLFYNERGILLSFTSVYPIQSTASEPSHSNCTYRPKFTSFLQPNKPVGIITGLLAETPTKSSFPQVYRRAVDPTHPPIQLFPWDFPWNEGLGTSNGNPTSI